MNPLTADRAEVAALVADVLDAADLEAWNVYANPPASIVTPAVVCTPADPVAKYTHRAHSAPVTLWLFADALNLEQLEDALCALLAAGVTGLEVTTAPAAQRYGGATYLGAVVTVPRTVALEAPAAP